MTAGDFSFDTVFRRSPSGESEGAQEILFPPISYILWIIFVILMPVLFTNMLVSICLLLLSVMLLHTTTDRSCTFTAVSNFCDISITALVIFRRQRESLICLKKVTRVVIKMSQIKFGYYCESKIYHSVNICSGV